MRKCPVKGQFDVCKKETFVSGGNYTYIVAGRQEGVVSQEQDLVVPEKQFAKQTMSKKSIKVEAARKTSGGALLALVQRLLKNKERGVPYSTLNNYFRSELGDGTATMTQSFIYDILTYDPKDSSDTKSYDDVLQALDKASSKNISWLEIWDIIDGLSAE